MVTEYLKSVVGILSTLGKKFDVIQVAEPAGATTSIFVSVGGQPASVSLVTTLRSLCVCRRPDQYRFHFAGPYKKILDLHPAQSA